MKIDLLRGVVPISKAAASLAGLLRRSAATGEAIVITQKGYPAGIVLDIKAYERLRAAAERGAAAIEAAAGREV